MTPPPPPQQAPEIERNYQHVLSACTEVSSSTRLKRTLSLVLQLGNGLNSGRHAAQGFRLASLLKLHTTKAFGHTEVNLLHLLAAQVSWTCYRGVGVC